MKSRGGSEHLDLDKARSVLLGLGGSRHSDTVSALRHENNICPFLMRDVPHQSETHIISSALQQPLPASCRLSANKRRLTAHQMSALDTKM